MSQIFIYGEKNDGLGGVERIQSTDQNLHVQPQSQADIEVLASAARTASNNSSDLTMHGTGVIVAVDMTAVPTVETVTPKIQQKDSITGKYRDVLTGPAIVAVGTYFMRVHPGIAVVANESASDVLSRIWRMVFTHSAGGSFTYQVGASLIY